MSLIQANKNIDISIKYGDGKKDGVVKQWHNKEQVEQVELHMDIVIDYILQHYMLILWMNSLHHKY
jgi:hypothetical protein